MVSMSGAMSAGAAASYYEKDNYYMKGDLSEKGEWFGNGAEHLGLKGEVDINDFKALLHGYDPAKMTDEHIKALDQFAKTESSINSQLESARKEGSDEKTLAAQDRVTEYNQIHKAFDEKLEDGAKLVRDGHNQDGMVTHRGAFDVTFSAPKSVSVAALVGGDARLVEAHKNAVNEAMGYIQDHFAQTRVREDGGRNNVNTGELTVAQFTHYTARGVDGQAPDPDLHTHNAILNITHVDGKPMSLEPQQIYTAQKLADQIYQNELARGAQELGYAVTWNRHGDNHTMEIKGFSPEVMAMFSKRDEQINSAIEAFKAEHGREPSKAEREIIGLETRADKEVQKSDEVRADWDRQLQEKGLDKESLMEQIKDQVSDKALASNAREAVENGTKDMADQKSVFTNHEITFAALKNSHGEQGIKEIVSELKGGETKAVALDATDQKNSMTEKYTSSDIIAAEKSILTAIADGKGAMVPAASKEQFNELVAGNDRYENLKEGQKDSLERVMTTEDKYNAIVGDAGTGKSTMIGVLNELVTDKLSDKVELHGLAPMGTAAAGLEEKGLKSQTVDSFLLKADPDKFNDGKNHIIIVDETSTLSTEKFNALVEFGEKVDNVKMIFMGDDKQQQAVGAGSMFKYAVREGEIDSSRMTESIRQNLAQEGVKDTVEAFKHVDRVEEGMQMLKDHDRLIEAEVKIDEKTGQEYRDIGGLKDKFVENLANDIEQRGSKEAMGIVYTNAERAELGERTREALQEKGVLGEKDHTFSVLESKNLSHTDSKLAMSYEKGDILVNSNRFADMKSKTESVVSDIDKEGNRLQLQYENKHGETVERWIDAEKGDKFNAYREVERTFNEGERITFTNRDDSIGVKNGEFATIHSISEDGKIIAEKEGNGRLLQIDPQQNRHFDQGMVITPNKSQGMSFEAPHVYIDSNSGLNNHNANHVATSRATDELRVYSDNAEKALDKWKDEQLKENYHDYVKDDNKAIEDKDLDQKAELESKESPQDIKIEEPEKSFDEKLADLKAEFEKSVDENKQSFDEKLEELTGGRETDRESGTEQGEGVERRDSVEREFNQEADLSNEKTAEKESEREVD